MIFAVLKQKESKAVEAAFLSVISRPIWMDLSRFEREVLENDSIQLYQLVYFMVEKVYAISFPIGG